MRNISPSATSPLPQKEIKEQGLTSVVSMIIPKKLETFMKASKVELNATRGFLGCYRKDIELICRCYMIRHSYYKRNKVAT